MTSTVTEATIAAIRSMSYEVLSSTVGIIVIMLLIMLLIQKELLRALGGPRSKQWMQTLDVAIAPLLLVFGLIIIVRLIHLL